MKVVLKPGDSINEAIKLNSCALELEIFLKKGIYKEKVVIDKDNVRIIGESKDDCIIVYDDYNYKFHEDGLFYNTFRTSTLKVLGNNCRLESLTVKNNCGNGELIGPAISLSVYGNYFKATNCVFSGYQDTLFIGPLPSDLFSRYSHILSGDELVKKEVLCIFDRCKIIGNTDFIFGSGTCLLNECDIEAIGDKVGYVCAPSTSLDSQYGFIFNNCKVNNLGGCGVYLARPWREDGSCIFNDCIFNGLISDKRYDAWGRTSMRFYEIPYVKNQLSSVLNDIELNRLNNYTNTLRKLFNK